MKKLFIIGRKKDIDFCFDKCGKINVSGIVELEGGYYFTCSQEDCPFENQTLELGCFEIGGTPFLVIARKLRDSI